MGIFKKKNVKTNSACEKLDRLTPEGNLPFGWVSYNQDFIESKEAPINEAWSKVYQEQDRQKKLQLFREYFDVVNRIGSECKEAGECEYKWFCECIINSDWYNETVSKYEKLKKG